MQTLYIAPQILLDIFAQDFTFCVDEIGYIEQSWLILLYSWIVTWGVLGKKILRLRKKVIHQWRHVHQWCAIRKLCPELCKCCIRGREHDTFRDRFAIGCRLHGTLWCLGTRR